MDLIDIIKPLSTVISSAVNKSQQWRESNPGLLGAKQERNPLCYEAPQVSLNFLEEKLCNPSFIWMSAV